MTPIGMRRVPRTNTALHDDQETRAMSQPTHKTDRTSDRKAHRRAHTSLAALSLATTAAIVGVTAIGPADLSREAHATVAVAQEGHYEVDAVHSMIVFGIKHMGVANNYGRFNNPEGTFHINMESPADSFIDVKVKASNVDTANSGRDNHLKGPDLFNAKQNPYISFKSTQFTKTGDTTFDVTGDMTLFGTTKSITVEVEFIGEGDAGRGMKQGIESRFTVKRSDFGNDTYIAAGALSDEVELIVALEGDLK